jgi:hypothetical protein
MACEGESQFEGWSRDARLEGLKVGSPVAVLRRNRQWLPVPALPSHLKLGKQQESRLVDVETSSLPTDVTKGRIEASFSRVLLLWKEATWFGGRQID